MEKEVFKVKRKEKKRFLFKISKFLLKHVYTLDEFKFAHTSIIKNEESLLRDDKLRILIPFQNSNINYRRVNKKDVDFLDFSRKHQHQSFINDVLLYTNINKIKRHKNIVKIYNDKKSKPYEIEIIGLKFKEKIILALYYYFKEEENNG